jgi:CHAT domain-containing protein
LDQCEPELERQITSEISARKYNEALIASRELKQTARARFGEDSRCYADALAREAVALQLLERPAEAGPLFEHALALFRKIGPSDDPKLTLTLNNFGVHRFQLRQYPDAAKLHEEALELRRKRRPLDGSAVAESLHNLADAYRYLEREPRDVAKLYRESLEIKARILPPNYVSIAQTRQNLASALELLRDLKGAGQQLQQALDLYRNVLPSDDPRVAAVINRQALLLFMQGSNLEAEKKFQEAVRLQRASPMAQKAALAATLDDFAVNEMVSGHLPAAKALAQEALTLRRAILLNNNPTIARTLSNLSQIAWLGRNYGEALRLAREASKITVANAQFDRASRLRLQRHVRMAWSEGTQKIAEPAAALTGEAFIIGQHAIRTDTAATLSRSALRFSARDSKLRELLKEVDDIDSELPALERTLTHSLTLSADESAEAFSALRTRMTALAERRNRLFGEIEKSSPDYAQLINPKPLSVDTAKELLKPEEALVTFEVGFEEIYVWCVTREQIVWRKLDLRPEQLKAIVARLRAGLDVEPEETSPEELAKPLFDLGLAYELYEKLLGAISSTIANKSKLLVVPSGPLTTLPLHLLVTTKPVIANPTRKQPGAYQSAGWLANRYAISVLPSVESLESLRRRAQPSDGRKPLIGFANPLPSPDFVPTPEPERVASAQRGRGRIAKLRRGLPAAIWSRQGVDTNALRAVLKDKPLKNSEKELTAVGEILGADSEDLLMGPNATESAAKLKDLSGYRIIYFATHGYIAGAFNGSLTEPALALTMPKQPNEFDDGLLTATEIAQLKLDADWVVLSACETAAGSSDGAEGLSGLARAFFHAGARALLVSHWSLDDLSAMQLMTTMFQTLKSSPNAGRSQAFRQAMLKQIQGAGRGDKDKLWDAYPGRWAAFEMVGLD